mmetsp:Transcript_2283/g.8827  ORF Transcript_2283/g.8827 Transcript_2283/m.8827 type:complete len:204 (-) Transcript_2283:2870-3481(-)
MGASGAGRVVGARAPGGHRARVQGQVPRQLASHVPGSRPDANRGALRLQKHVHQGWDDRPHHRERQPRAHGVLLQVLPVLRHRRVLLQDVAAQARVRREDVQRPKVSRGGSEHVLRVVLHRGRGITRGIEGRVEGRVAPAPRVRARGAALRRGRSAKLRRAAHVAPAAFHASGREQPAGLRQARERGRGRAGAGADGGGVGGD